MPAKVIAPCVRLASVARMIEGRFGPWLSRVPFTAQRKEGCGAGLGASANLLSRTAPDE